MGSVSEPLQKTVHGVCVCVFVRACAHATGVCCAEPGSMAFQKLLTWADVGLCWVYSGRDSRARPAGTPRVTRDRLACVAESERAQLALALHRRWKVWLTGRDEPPILKVLVSLLLLGYVRACGSTRNKALALELAVLGVGPDSN